MGSMEQYYKRVTIEARRNYRDAVKIGPVSRNAADELAKTLLAREYTEITMTDVVEVTDVEDTEPPTVPTTDGVPDATDDDIPY